jgi:hypothetical protein
MKTQVADGRSRRASAILAVRKMKTLEGGGRASGAAPLNSSVERTALRVQVMQSIFLSFNKEPFERADLLIVAGFCTLACGLLVLVAPRVGIVFLEILAGLVLVMRAAVVWRRARKARQLHPQIHRARARLRIRFLDRYELFLIVVVIFVQGGISGLLRLHGLPEGLVRILPLVMFGTGLLVRPRVLQWIANRRAASTQAPEHTEQRADATSSGDGP